jgi:hypothetical protein
MGGLTNNIGLFNILSLRLIMSFAQKKKEFAIEKQQK